MAWLYFLVFGPVLVGLVLAFLWWLIRGRRAGSPVGVALGFTLAAGLIALLADVGIRLVGMTALLPFNVSRDFWNWYSDVKFAIPLVVGILGALLLSFPIRSRYGKGTAELARRTPVSFARATWFVAPGVVVVLSLLITVLAGAASQPDSTTGRYTMYFVELGGESGMGTTIYGWFYSVPDLILMGIIIVITAVGLSLIARTGLSEDREGDTRERTVRSRNIIAAGTGALLLHLEPVFQSLAAAASLRATFPVQGGAMTFWPTFAALGPVFSAASLLSAALGIAFWATILFSALRSRRSSRITVEQ